jgi:anti-sigma factor RsiW
MKRPIQSISVHQLHAYADGFLTRPEQKRVEAWLAGHPRRAAQVSDWQAINAALRRLGGGEASGASGLPRALALRARVARWARVAAVAAALVLAALGGWTVRERTAGAGSDFVTHAAVAFQLFAAPHQGRPVELKADERERLQRWLSGKAGLNVAMNVPELDEVGWQLIGGRMLADARGPAALYLYQDKEGGRVSLYAAPGASASQPPGALSERGPVRVFHWSRGPLRLALAGDCTVEELRQLLAPIDRQILAAATTGAAPAASGAPARNIVLVSGLNPRH